MVLDDRIYLLKLKVSGPIVISIEIFAPFQFVPVRVKTREHHNISIAEDIYCLKAVNSKFVNTDALVTLQLGWCV